MRLILASASPRRAELLRAAGIEFDVMPANADETVHPGETPEAYVRRIAEAKATAVTARANGRPVLAADTVVVVDDVILGKPVGRDDAKRMLRLLSGRAHEVLTAVSLFRGPTGSAPHVDTSAPHVERPGGFGVTLLSGADPSGPRGGPESGVPAAPARWGAVARPALTRVELTTVEFAPLTEGDIDWYVATGEPDDKAGGYAIQGYASRFITRIAGSYSNVVGLPVALVHDMLKQVGSRP